MSDHREIYEAVLAGHRLPRPSKMPNPVYNLMMKCARAAASERPDFEMVLSTLRSFKPREEIVPVAVQDGATPYSPIQTQRLSQLEEE